MQVSAIDYHTLAEGEDAAQASGLPILHECTPVRWLKDTASLAEALMHVRCPLMKERELTDHKDAGLWRDLPSLDRLIVDAPSEFSRLPGVPDATSAYFGGFELSDHWRAGEDDPPLMEEPTGSLSHGKVILLEERNPADNDEQLWNPCQLPTEVLEGIQSDGLVVEDGSWCVTPHKWLDSILLGGMLTACGIDNPNALTSTTESDFNADLEAGILVDREAFEKSAALSTEIRAWLTIPAAELLPALSDLDLGIDAWAPLATSKVCMTLPDAEGFLSPLSTLHAVRGAAAAEEHDDAPALGRDAKTRIAFCLPEIPEDDPDAVDWSTGLDLPRISLIALGVATLPSLWELENVVDRKYEWPHPDRSLFGASRPAPLPQTTQKQLAEIFEGSCWRLGHKQLEIPSLAVPELSSLLPMSHEAATLLKEDGHSNSGLRLGFVGAVASASFLSSHSEKLLNSPDLQCHNFQVEIENSDIDDLLRDACGDDACFAALSSSWHGTPQHLLSGAEEISFSVDEEWTWPTGNNQGQAPMTKLKAFQKLGPLPLSLVSDRPRVMPLKARKVKDADRGPRVELTTAQQVGPSGEKHFYEGLPLESDLVLQLQGDMELVWATYCSHTDGAGSADASMPDSSGLQALLRQHAEDFLRAKEAGDDATDTKDLYRILLAFHILQTIHAELTDSGILQAVFCADALLARFPPSLLDGNMWTCQAIRKLHVTIVQVCEASSIAPEIRDIPRPAGITMTSIGTPKQFCAYAKCTGCGPSSLTLAERTKSAQLFYLGDAAASHGRWLVVVFASQCVLEAVSSCCWRFGDGRKIIVLDALSPLQHSAQQIYAAGVGLVLAHETALHTSFRYGVGDEQDSLSAENIVAQREICRLLQQHCTVVSYQPLTVSAIDLLVDIRLAMCTSDKSSVQRAVPQPVLARKEEVAWQMQANAGNASGTHSHPSCNNSATLQVPDAVASQEHLAGDHHEPPVKEASDAVSWQKHLAQDHHELHARKASISDHLRDKSPYFEYTADVHELEPRHSGYREHVDTVHRHHKPPSLAADTDEQNLNQQIDQQRADAAEPRLAHHLPWQGEFADLQKKDHQLPLNGDHDENQKRNQSAPSRGEHADAQRSRHHVPQLRGEAEAQMHDHQRLLRQEDMATPDFEKRYCGTRQPPDEPDAGQHVSEQTERHSRTEPRYSDEYGDLPKFRQTCQRLKQAWEEQDNEDHELSSSRAPGYVAHHERKSRHELAQPRDIWGNDFSCTPPSHGERTLHDRHTPEQKASSRGRVTSSGHIQRDAPPRDMSRGDRRRSAAWGRIPAMNLSYGDMSVSSTGKNSNGRGEKRRHPDGGYGMFGALRRGDNAHAPLAHYSRAETAHAPVHHSMPRRSARSSRDGLPREHVARASTRHTPVRFDPWAD